MCNRVEAMYDLVIISVLDRTDRINSRILGWSGRENDLAYAIQTYFHFTLRDGSSKTEPWKNNSFHARHF